MSVSEQFTCVYYSMEFERIEKKLTERFSVPSLRDNQRNTLKSLLKGEDVFLCCRTGGRKSLEVTSTQRF